MKRSIFNTWLLIAALAASLQPAAWAQNGALDEFERAAFGATPDQQKRVAFNKAMAESDPAAAIVLIESSLPSLNDKAWLLLLNKMLALEGCKREPLNWDNKQPPSKCERGITMFTNAVDHAILKNPQSAEMQNVGVGAVLLAGVFHPSPYAIELEMQRVQKRSASISEKNFKSYAQAVANSLITSHSLIQSRLNPNDGKNGLTSESYNLVYSAYQKIIMKTGIYYFDLVGNKPLSKDDFESIVAAYLMFLRGSEAGDDWLRQLEQRAKDVQSHGLAAHVVLTVAYAQSNNKKAAKVHAQYFKESKVPELARLANDIISDK